jgi:hypothetical protein
LVKLNRIAVLLAGDFRQWPRAAEYIFAFAEQQAVTVDYYFATWTTTQDFWCTNKKEARTRRPVTNNDITCEFVKYNKNLINFQLVKQIIQPDTTQHFTDVTFYYQTYLAKLANIMKRRYELDNDFVYDQVFEIRPDLYIFDEFNIPVKLTDFEWLNEICYKQDGRFHQWPVAQDLYYQANSFSNDIMAERFYYKKSIEYNHTDNNINNHWILCDYSYARRMQAIPLVKPNFQMPLRPNFPDDPRQYNWLELSEYEAKWQQLV